MRVGDRDVLSSGTIITQYGDDSVEITFADLTFKLIFKHGDGGQPAVTGEGGGKILTLYFTNFDNLFGTAWTSEVADIADDKKLSLAIFVHTLGEGEKLNRLVNFTFSSKVK